MAFHAIAASVKCRLSRDGDNSLPPPRLLPLVSWNARYGRLIPYPVGECLSNLFLTRKYILFYRIGDLIHTQTILVSKQPEIYYYSSRDVKYIFTSEIKYLCVITIHIKSPQSPYVRVPIYIFLSSFRFRDQTLS
jgi:hypothetical protein